MANGSGGPLDGFYTKYFIVGIILSVLPCCSLIGLILNLIGYFTAVDPLAKKNAKICLFISLALILISFILNFALGLGGMLMGGR